MNRARAAAGAVVALALATAVWATAFLDHPLSRPALVVALLALAGGLVVGAAGGPGAFRVGIAMLRRTTLTYRSYRVQVVSVFVWTGLTLALYYVAAGPLFRLLLGLEGGTLPRHLVAFLAVGLTTWPLFWKAWESTALGVRGEQWEGTFESAVPMPNGTRALPVGYLLSRLPFTLLFAGLSLAAISISIPGAMTLGSFASIVEFFVVVLLAIVCMWALGLIFGGLAILYKQVGPVDLVIRTLFLFLSGVFLPIEIFPAWAQAVSKLLPVTHAYTLLHYVSAGGIPLHEARTATLALAAWTTIAVVGGTLVYHLHVDKARRRGATQGY